MDGCGSNGLIPMEAPSQEHSTNSSLLVDRKQAAQLIGCALNTVRRMEDDKRLTPVRLRRGRASKVYYRRSQILALVGEVAPASHVIELRPHAGHAEDENPDRRQLERPPLLAIERMIEDRRPSEVAVDAAKKD